MNRPRTHRVVFAETAPQDDWPDAEVAHPFTSSFEMMAACSKGLPPRLGLLLAVLLDAASPSRCGGRAVLHPLWAAEAMHRAFNIVHLVTQLHRTAESHRRDDVALWLDHRLASDLAALLEELNIEQDEEKLPCASVLRSVVRNLVALFGSCAGGVVIRTDIERLSLPAYKRRALVLAVGELVVNALRHGFAGRCGGQIEVTLRESGSAHARLTVVDDGVGYRENSPNGQHGIAGALAELLEADLVYRRVGIIGTSAEILFPTYPCHSVGRTGQDQSIADTLVQ